MKKPDHPRLDSQTLKKRLEEDILSELLPYRQWVVWRFVLAKNQWKKQPFNPANGRAAKTNDRSTWGKVSPGVEHKTLLKNTGSFQALTPVA
jgi:primase-polymerase (primpol)-like protein